MPDFHGFGPALLAGTAVTLQLAACALALGLLLGLGGALAKTSAHPAWRWLGNAYSTVVRGVPELLWVLFIYLGTIELCHTLGALFGYPQFELNPFTAGTIALGLCFGAYATEVFRGALLAIPKGQTEAGAALGLTQAQVFLHVTLPQMWRIALPGLGNLFMILMKDTALVSVIGLQELMRATQMGVTVTKQPFTFFLTAALIYLLMTIIAMIALHLLEKRVNRGFTRSRA